MEEGFEGARFQMIVYAPSESGLSDTKIPEDKLQSGRTPVAAVVSAAPVHRARGIDEADVAREGRVSVGKPPIPRRIYVQTAVRVFALAHGFRRGVGKAGTVVAEQGQLASRCHVAGQADFRTGRKEDFVGATLRTAAVYGRLAYGVGRSQQGRNEVRGEARKKARFRVVFVVVAPYVRIRRGASAPCWALYHFPAAA